jgi:2-succinyl-5-enolpyruvyl-6-hydroxy-3-cyclohexene-1-carboxylate synthase
LPIFAQLEEQPEASRFWLTPPAADLSHAAALYGHRYERLSEASEIRSAMQRAIGKSGTTLLHIIVGDSSARDAEMRVRADLEQAPGLRS